MKDTFKRDLEYANIVASNHGVGITCFCVVDSEIKELHEERMKTLGKLGLSIYHGPHENEIYPPNDLGLLTEEEFNSLIKAYEWERKEENKEDETN